MKQDEFKQALEQLPLNARAKAILTLMKENPDITQSEIEDHLHVTVETISRYIRGLKKDGLIERIGPAHGGHWKVNL